VPVREGPSAWPLLMHPRVERTRLARMARYEGAKRRRSPMRNPCVNREALSLFGAVGAPAISCGLQRLRDHGVRREPNTFRAPFALGSRGAKRKAAGEGSVTLTPTRQVADWPSAPLAEKLAVYPPGAW
jgi:hypothetical protein